MTSHLMSLLVSQLAYITPIVYNIIECGGGSGKEKKEKSEGREGGENWERRKKGGRGKEGEREGRKESTLISFCFFSLKLNL